MEYSRSFWRKIQNFGHFCFDFWISNVTKLSTLLTQCFWTKMSSFHESHSWNALCASEINIIRENLSYMKKNFPKTFWTFKKLFSKCFYMKSHFVQLWQIYIHSLVKILLVKPYFIWKVRVITNIKYSNTRHIEMLHEYCK